MSYKIEMPMQAFKLFSGALLDFELACGLDCDRCWPIKYLKCRPRVFEVNKLGAVAVC